MKICEKCKQELSLDCFSWKSKEKEKRNTCCRECHKIYRKEHYLKNKKKYVEKAVKWKREAVNSIRKYKEKPCADCKIEYPFYVMHFDHLRDKKFNLSLGWTYSKERVLEEIKKCDVVCANCHAIRTHKRKAGLL